MENTELIENRRTVEYNLVGLHLKFVLENGGEYRAHREQENGGIQSSWITFDHEICAEERWKT